MLTKSEKSQANQLLAMRAKPEEFSVKLLQIIADDSQEGKKRLIELAQKAEMDYNKPKKQAVTGIIYSQYRQRDPQIDIFIKKLKQSSNGYERAEAFASVISTGQLFVDSSYNYHLFVAIIESLIKFNVKDHSVYPIGTLKTILEGKLDEYIKDNKSAFNSSQKTKIELDEITKAKIDSTKISNDFIKAQKLATEQKQLTSFCLIYSKEGWYFSWIDNLGNENQLVLSEKAKKMLPIGEGSDISKINKENIGPLKIELCHIKDVYLKAIRLKEKDSLAKIQVLINSKESPENLHSTFLLNRNPDNDQLLWVNYLNKSMPIAIEKYPHLQKWLANHSTIEEDELIELKKLLLKVDTSQKVDKSAKEKLMHQFIKPFEKKPLEVEPKALDLKFSLNTLEQCLANKLLLTKPYEKKTLEEEPKPLNLKLFNKLEKCMANKLKDIDPQASSLESVPEIQPKKIDLRLFSKVNESVRVKQLLSPVELPKPNKLDLNKDGKFKDLIQKLTHEEQAQNEDDDLMQLFSSSI